MQRGYLTRWLSSSRDQSAAAVKVLQLCPVPEKLGLLRLAVLRDDAVECWQVSLHTLLDSRSNSSCPWFRFFSSCS
jgi:hypothetical protein